jgi:hypothetical protein
MIDPNNPYDATIWDPDGEHAIEDSVHGPSAVGDMLQTPAMPLGDGRYYQSGGYYTFGTPYVDSQNRPVRQIFPARSTYDSMLEADELHEWLDAARTGGDGALLALDTERQRKRLDQTGYAHCFKPSDACPGGKQIQDCETGGQAFEAGNQWAERNSQEKPGEETLSNVIAWAGGACVACSVSCEVAVKTAEGVAQETRVTFYRPSPTFRSIQMPPIEQRTLTESQLAAFEDLFYPTQTPPDEK